MTPTPGRRSGFVYLITDGTYTKIGRVLARTPERDLLTRRIAFLQTGNALQLEYVAWAWVADSNAVEAALHKQLAARRIRSEWFILGPATTKWAAATLAAHAIEDAKPLDVYSALSIIRAHAGLPPPEPQKRRRGGSPHVAAAAKRKARREIAAALDAHPELIHAVLRPPRVVCGHRFALTGRPCRLTTVHNHA